MIEKVLKKERNRYIRLMIFGIILAGITIIISIVFGQAKISLYEVYNIFKSKILSLPITDSINEAIVFDIRLPRILTGLLVGAGLGVSGVIFQSVLRNPLADPYTIGVSTGAAFGAVLTIYINLVLETFIPVMPIAFLFAILTLVIIILITGRNTLHSSRLILAGIIVGAVFSAGISLLKFLAGEDVGAMIFWLMGKLSAKSWSHVALLFPFITIGIYLAVVKSDDLDVLTLGIEEAKSVGVDGQKSLKFFLIIGALLTAVCVSVSGIIGFVGLVVPHLIRMGFSPKHKYLIPLSALYSGIILTVADNATRLLFQVEIPVGIITTLIGGPFFIYIYSKKKGQLL